MFGNADPYVTVTVGNQIKQTSVCPGGGMNPSWDNAILKFDINNENNITILMYDKETTGTDRYMGECTTSIIEWMNNGYNGGLQIVNKQGKFEGVLLVEVMYKSAHTHSAPPRPNVPSNYQNVLSSSSSSSLSSLASSSSSSSSSSSLLQSLSSLQLSSSSSPSWSLLLSEIKSVFRHPQISTVVHEVYKTTLAPPQR